MSNNNEMKNIENVTNIDEGINQGANRILNKGICIDNDLGESIIENAITSVIEDLTRCLD